MDVPLPRTWRPLGARFASYLAGAMLLALSLTVWFAWGPEIRSHFTGLQRATLVLLGLMVFACLWALIRSRVAATEDGLKVVNGYRTHRFEWPEVLGCQLRRGAPFALLDLSDGSSLALFGIQGSDGARARTAVREVRALAARYGTATPGD